MSVERGPPSTQIWADACLAARLLALDPPGIGGVWLRAPAGPVRDRWLAIALAALRPGAPVVRVPSHATDGTVLGGLDLAATLRTGRPVTGGGLLAAADDGLLILPMAERLPPGTAGRITAALDRGEVPAPRDGVAQNRPARFGIVALDEGIDDETPPAALSERLAIHLDLAALSWREAEAPAALDLAAARALRPDVILPTALLDALCGAAHAFGIASLRPPLLAARLARGVAALDGRSEVAADDAAVSARLVLAPRATRLPAAPDQPEEAPEPDRRPDDDAQDDRSETEQQRNGDIDELLLAAIASAIPAGLLDAMTARAGVRARGGSGGGAHGRSRMRGRPVGTLRGDPRRGARLNLIETLRAAAPWQSLRRNEGSGRRIVVHRDDLRTTRFKTRTETTTVMIVDASGSAAAHRLAEAKGAVELLLADCYIRRDRVALIAFRGVAADLLLPPTRSLARAKRSIAALPGGGGTPLAHAFDAARELGDAIKRSGGTPVLVFLTDGRANIARDGTPGRERAGQDALAAARRLRAEGHAALLIDTAPRPSDVARDVAVAAGARYQPLPAADARSLSGLVRREIGAEAGTAATRLAR